MSTPSAQVGRVMVGMGALFAFLGFVIFDNGLLALGNIFLVTGTFTSIGMARTRNILLKSSNLKFTAFFLSGVFVVLTGRPRTGMLLEFFGLYHMMKTFVYAYVETPIKFIRSYIGI
mmetsp:Transcript_27208/g.66190  ORF Transcript_27208/g.66190 Transcript_27208/m.66190 type:complete len:117 (+) Transcript_27208:257-607(+)